MTDAEQILEARGIANPLHALAASLPASTGSVDDLYWGTEQTTARGWSKAPWIPYSPEIVCDWFGWTEEAVRDQFGDTVLVRLGLSEIEFRPGPPSPERMRARVSEILRDAEDPEPANITADWTALTFTRLLALSLEGST